MLTATALMLLPALLGDPGFDLSVHGHPMQGQELSVVVTAPPGTGFCLRSDEWSALGVTGEDGRWLRSILPSAGRLRLSALARAADGGLLTDELELAVREAYRPQPGDVVLSEIHRTEQWVELFNRTPYELDLAGWTLRDDAGDLIVLEDAILPAHSFLVIEPGASFLLEESQDEVVLAGASGTVLDRAAYDVIASWPASVPGVSMQLARQLMDAEANDQPSAWIQSATSGASVGSITPGGSPGRATPCLGNGAPLVDVPDPSYLDTNCDGIDGDIARAVFVSKSGSPANPGTMDEPLDSIQDAILLAAQDPARDHVYVAEGAWYDTLVLADGVSVWGGYSDTNGWQRSGAYITILRANFPVAEGMVGIRGTSLQAPITLGSVRVETADSDPGTSMHNYGILLQYSANVRLEGVVVAPGEGGWGTAGQVGANGAAGVNGKAGSASGVGGGYTTGPGGTGGYGGNGGSVSGYNGAAGAGSNPGNGGWGGDWTLPGSSGGSGGNGSNGPSGSPPSNAVSISGGVLLVNGLGTGGGKGVSGSGGGGGGGGGGNVFFYTGCGGGSGGSGGGSGNGGFPGTPGGTSVGLLLADSVAHLEGCTILAGDGGWGGSGGAAGLGGKGGNGGAGGQQSGLPSGGKGGNGGAGGNGSLGAGGGGGHAYGIVIGPTSSATLSSSSIVLGSEGLGGYPNYVDGESVGIKQL